MAGTAVYTVGISAMCFNDSNYSASPATRGIIIAGPFNAVNEFNYAGIGIARLTREGFVDPSFNSGTGFQNLAGIGVCTVTCLCDIDGVNFFAVGNFDTYNGANTCGIVIIDNTGAIVVSFPTGTGPRVSDGGFHDSTCTWVVKRGDGKFYVCGGFDYFGGDTAPFNHEQVVCMDSGGAIDTSFDTTAFPTLYSGTNLQSYNQMAVERVSGALTNRVLCVGFAITRNGLFTDSGYGMALYNANGTPDTSFTTNTAIPFNDGTNVPGMKCCITQLDGKYLIGGGFQNWLGDTAKRFVVRLNTSGLLDGTFNTNADTTSNTSVDCIGVQEGLGGQRIIIGGLFFGVWGIAALQRSCIARLNISGEVDGLTISGVTSGAI